MSHWYVEQLAITLLMVTFLQHLLFLPKNMNAISIAGSLACLGLLLSTWNLISSKCHHPGQSWFVDLSIVKTWAIAALLHSQTLDHLPKAAVSVQPSKPEVPYLCDGRASFWPSLHSLQWLTIPPLMTPLISALLVHSYKTQSFTSAHTTYIIIMQCQHSSNFCVIV